MCPLVLPGARIGLSAQEERVHIACPKPKGENDCWQTGVSNLSLRSLLLLQPLGVPPTPAPAQASHEVLPKTVGFGPTTKCNAGSGASGPPSVTHRRCTAFPGTLQLPPEGTLGYVTCALAATAQSAERKWARQWSIRP